MLYRRICAIDFGEAMHFRRLFLFLSISAPLLALSGCATPTDELLVNGNPEPLANLILTRQIDLDAYQPMTFGDDTTALCAMVASHSPVAIRAVDYLIENGVSINKKCTVNSVLGYTALDYALDSAYQSQETLGPYEDPRSTPSRFPIYMETIKKLLANGAKTADGLDSLDAIYADIKIRNFYNDKHVAAWKEEIRKEEEESRRNSIFTAENLVTAAAMASTATAIYSANNAQGAMVQSGSTLTPATMNSSSIAAAAAAVNSSNAPTANTSLQNIAGINVSTDNARAARSQELDNIVSKLSAEGNIKTVISTYRCSAEEPLQSVTVPYKTEACRAAKENWFAVYACNNVERMSAANEQCRVGCGNIQCDEGRR